MLETTTIPNLAKSMHQKKINSQMLSEASGVHRDTIYRACQGKSLLVSTAGKIVTALHTTHFKPKRRTYNCEVIPNLSQMMKQKKMSNMRLEAVSGVSHNTIQRARNGVPVRECIGEWILEALAR